MAVKKVLVEYRVVIGKCFGQSRQPCRGNFFQGGFVCLVTYSPDVQYYPVFSVHPSISKCARWRQVIYFSWNQTKRYQKTNVSENGRTLCGKTRIMFTAIITTVAHLFLYDTLICNPNKKKLLLLVTRVWTTNWRRPCDCYHRLRFVSVLNCDELPIETNLSALCNSYYFQIPIRW